MKTITKTYNVYEYNELSEKAKEKALAKHVEHSDYPFLSEYLYESLLELLKKNKITPLVSITDKKNPRVYYSLSYCQGDGVMFEGSFEWNGYSVVVKHSGHYYHENSKVIDITDEEGNSVDDLEPEDKFNEIYVRICKELEKIGYDEIEYRDSEEYFAELCEVNEYNFTADGTMVNE